MANEYGYTVCRRPNGTYIKGRTATGGAHSVKVLVRCPKGSKPVAIHHYHPGNDIRLSSKDISVGKRTGLAICVRAGNKVQCTDFKK